MGARICGAEQERDALTRAQCWCGGLFCGPGGFVKSKQFRAAFHPRVAASSRAEFEELMLQADLFDGDKIRDVWRTRLDMHRPPRVRRAS